MEYKIYQVDAFTDHLFGGNPASVIPLDKWLDDKKLSLLAQENNQPETSFYVKEEDGYRLRWFSPDFEIDLCGHATLAAAWVIFNKEDYRSDSIKFFTQSGIIYAIRNENLITIDMPLREPVPVPAPEALRKGLGIVNQPVLKSRDYVVVLESEEDVRIITPNFDELNKLDVLGVIVTAKGNDCDFVSRFFMPNTHALEDNATGSSHCSLAPYWSKQLGKKSFHAKQIGPRGAELLCNMVDGRLKISGKAVLYMEGKLFI